MHDLLFENQDELGEGDIEGYAGCLASIPHGLKMSYAASSMRRAWARMFGAAD